MLEGLEITEVLFSRFENENRFDSEYFRKVFMKADKYIKSKNHFNIGDYYKVTDGEHGSVIFQESGIKYLTAENIKKGYVDISKIRYVDKGVDERNARARVETGDVLISIKGTLGEIAVAEDWLLPANMNRDVAIIKPQVENIPSEYLALFLISEYGALQSLRGGSGGVQQMITLERLRKFVIPSFSNSFYRKVTTIYNHAKRCRILSQQAYAQAETLLLETLGLNNFKPTQEAVNIKSFKESFLSSGRLDAEYYQLKYEEIENKVKSSDAWSTLGKQLLKIDTGEYSPDYYSKDEKDELVFYIRSTNIKGGQIIFDDNYYVEKNKFVRIAKKGNIVTARVGSIGVFGEIREDIDGSVYSDNVLCFQLPANFIPSVYTLLFNSIYYFELIDRLARGSVQQRLNQETLKDLIIPIIDIQTQQQISNLIEKSFRLKKQSEQLLDLAKTAVEMAIEEDEEVAMNFISTKLKDLK